MSFSMQHYDTNLDILEKGVDLLKNDCNKRDNIHHKGPFQYGLTESGISIHAPEKPMAIILLEAVRNLKWKSNHAEEAAVNCPAGTVFLIPPHQAVMITWPKPTEHISVKIGEAESVINCGENISFDIERTPENLVRFSSKQCLQICQIIWEYLRSPADDDANYINSLYAVLINMLLRSALVAQTGGGTQAGLSSYACRQIEIYLKENFRNPISVPEMAALLGISAGHFATCFRESFGQTPHQYLMKLKLNDAERCLRETDMPISEIAARLNFSSQSHLTTALRKYRHLTPGEIRRRGKPAI